MNLSLNSQYALKNEPNCSYLIKINRTDRRIDKNIYDNIEPIIPMPPIFGYILSQFRGNDFREITSSIHKELNISEEKIIEFVTKIINNEHSYKMKFQSLTIEFPPYILTENEKETKIITFNNFHPFDKFIVKRPSFPLFINLMITSKCETDCIYCYADRSREDDLATNTILKKIDEAYKEGLIHINISGGDIFSNKDWKKILKKLSEYNFYPFLSTKIPLKETDINFLKEIGVSNIQFSIDSFLPEEIKKIVRRDEKYLAEVKKTFCYLQKYGIHLGIRSVLTKYNSSLESIKNTLNFLENYNDIIETWDITPAFYSEFRGNYDNYQPHDDDLKKIFDFLTETKSVIPIKKNNLIGKLTYKNNVYKDENDFICKNKICVANTYSMSIVSNGKVNFCELMYYNKDFG